MGGARGLQETIQLWTEITSPSVQWVFYRVTSTFIEKYEIFVVSLYDNKRWNLLSEGFKWRSQISFSLILLSHSIRGFINKSSVTVHRGFREDFLPEPPRWRRELLAEQPQICPTGRLYWSGLLFIKYLYRSLWWPDLNNISMMIHQVLVEIPLGNHARIVYRRGEVKTVGLGLR